MSFNMQRSHHINYKDVLKLSRRCRQLMHGDLRAKEDIVEEKKRKSSIHLLTYYYRGLNIDSIRLLIGAGAVDR